VDDRRPVHAERRRSPVDEGLQGARGPGEYLRDELQVGVTGAGGLGGVHALDADARHQREPVQDTLEVGGVADADDDVVERLAALAVEDVDAGDVAGRGADGRGDATERAGAVGDSDADPCQHCASSGRLELWVGPVVRSAGWMPHRPGRMFRKYFVPVPIPSPPGVGAGAGPGFRRRR
jgi:hypothetical protein